SGGSSHGGGSSSSKPSDKSKTKTKAEEKIAEVTKLVGKVTAENLEASKVTLKAATDAIEEAKAAGWTESEIQS
ncbi:hypothetical protein BGU85_27835, partial [Clostridioides difficile]|uniref:hypothetical protein n=1 Tax=Clostridioides difficile TaxID=1496 RepID=UPI000BC5E726